MVIASTLQASYTITAYFKDSSVVGFKLPF